MVILICRGYVSGYPCSHGLARRSCTPRGPPCRSSAAPLYLDLRSREGGRLGVGCAVFGPRGACCGSSRRCDKPPALRAAPQRWASCCRFCRVRGHAPRACGAAPRSGAISWLLQRWCFAPGRFEICNEFHEGAKREPRRPNPRQEAHQTWGAATSVSEEAGGMPSHSAKPTQRAKRQPPTQRQVCPPPEA